MSLYRPLLLALTATSLIATPAAAAPSLVARALAMAGFDDQRPRDQDRAFRNKREGRSMPLPLIKQRVQPRKERMARRLRQVRGDDPQRRLLAVSSSHGHV